MTDPLKLNCTPHRPSPVSGVAKLPQAISSRLPLLNRFLYAPVLTSRLGQFVSDGEMYKPNDTYVATLNGEKPLPGNLKSGLALCMETYKRVGGFVLVDFFNEVCTYMLYSTSPPERLLVTSVNPNLDVCITGVSNQDR